MGKQGERLLELARKRFYNGRDELTRAERILFEAVAEGEEADLSGLTTTDGHHWTPPDDKPWPGSVAIPADRIAWLCTDTKARKLVTHKGVQVKGARFSGKLDLAFADITFPLVLLQCSIPDGINLRHARITALFLDGTHTGPIGADGLKVKGSVFLREDSKHRTFEAQGAVRLLGASIGGDLDCNGGRFLNPGKDTKALNADRLTVKGSVFLGDGFKAQGAVRLLNANIGGNLDCTGGLFRNPGGYALTADGVTVKGCVFLSDKFHVEGLVSLVAADIRLVLGLTGNDPDVQCLLDLRNARIGTLYDDATPWPAQLELDGFIYTHIQDESPKDATTRLKWLSRQPPKPFRPQPYEQLAKVLREAGHEEDAKKILIAKGDALRKLAWREGRLLKSFLQFLLGLSTGYGYRPGRPVLVLLGFLFLGFCVFKAGYQADVMAPVKQRSYLISKTLSENVPQKLIWDDYPDFNAFIYSLDSLVPLVDLRQEEHWMPSPGKSGICGAVPVAGWFVRVYYWLHVCLGWLFTTLGLAGLTGLIKK